MCVWRTNFLLRFGVLVCVLCVSRSIYRQHTSAYVSIRQHTSAYFSIRQHMCALCIAIYVPHTPAYVIRQHTSAYVLCVSLQNYTYMYMYACVYVRTEREQQHNMLYNML
jgi:hypothetical protein